MAKKPLTPKQVAALDRDNNGFAGGELSDAEKLVAASLLVEEVKPGRQEVRVLPSVGRMVHYYANAEDGPYAAIITKVNEGTDVALIVLPPPPGAVAAYSNVPYVDDLMANAPGWRWPEGAGGPAPTLANFTADLPHAFGTKRDR